MPADYTVVISTFERPGPLNDALESLALQSHMPKRVIIVDASENVASAKICERFQDRLPVEHRLASKRSAAIQRNEGAADVKTPLAAFMDDDVVLQPDTFALLCAPFDSDPKIGGVAGRIFGLEHCTPAGLLWWYYRFQAGYSHPNYGGRVIGPAINSLPCYDGTMDLIPSEWLNSTCVAYRTEAFASEQFPEFEGYSFMEDVHLSTRIAKNWNLYFHAQSLYEHRSQPSIFKKDIRSLAASRIRNQRLVATGVLGLSGPVFELKFLLHRMFASTSILRRRTPQWIEELRGTWS